MTDPIIQDQNQNGQNSQTTQTTPEIDFDLNLPTNEETSSTEEPVLSLDFSDLGTVETPQNETQQPKIEETPVIVEENQPKAEELQQNIINSIDKISLEQTNTIVETQPEIVEAQPETIKTEAEMISNPIDEIATELPPAPVEETEQQPTKEDNRLEQEDALVAEEKQTIKETPTIETKEIPEIKSETLNVFEENPTSDTIENNNETIETKQETTQNIFTSNNETIQTTQESTPTENKEKIPTIEDNNQEKPIPGQPGQNFPPSANLQQDQMIIQQLQESAGKPIEQAPIVHTTPTSTEVNLDDLLNSPTPQEQPSNQSNLLNQPNPSNLPNPSIIPAFTGIQWYSLPPIATQISEKINKPFNKKILINVGIWVFVFFVGWFMFKTMYPLEYQKMIGNWPQPTTIETQLTDNITLPTEEEIPANDSDLFNNPALDNYHGSAPDFSGVSEEEFNAFEDIEEEIPTDDKTIEKIQNYIDIGRKYTVIGKKNNDKEIMKSSLFLYKKASTLLTDIENETQISSDELSKQLSDLESYLQKLTWKNSDGEIVLQQSAQPTPEEFFWTQNSWSIQEPETTEEPTTTEIPTTNESWATNENETTTQENETENLSGNENSIIQSD